MRQFPAFLSLAIVSIAGNLMALDDSPTVTVTKDNSNYYVWECNQRSGSNASDIPLDVAATAVKDGAATQSDTAISEPIGFAGLSIGRMVKERTVTYDKAGAFFDAGEWNEFPVEKIGNAPMIIIFIFGTAIIALILMRVFLAIKPGPFKKILRCIIGAFIGLILTKMTLTLIGESVASSSLSTMTVFLCTLVGLAFGSATGILLGRKSDGRTKKEIVMKSLCIATGIFWGVVIVGAFLSVIDSILGLPAIRLPAWVIVTGLNIGVIFGAALRIIFSIDKAPKPAVERSAKRMEEHKKTLLFHCLTTLPLFTIVLPAVFGGWVGTSCMVSLAILFLILPWLLRRMGKDFKKAEASRKADLNKVSTAGPAAT